MKATHIIDLEVYFIQEGDFIVAFTPQLNLSSFGETVEDAFTAFDEMLKLWVEDTIEMGTFEQVMLEAGFIIEPATTSYKQPDLSSIAKDPQYPFPNLLLGSRRTSIEYA